MLPEQITQYLPTLAIAAGVVLLVWGQKDRLWSLVARLWPEPQSESSLSPAERFDRFYALRTWCEAAGHAEAVGALDGTVLPAIVRGKAVTEGGAGP